MKVEFLEPLHNEYIHGILGSVAPRGTGVQVLDHVSGTFKLANGETGFLLERDVVSEADWNSEQILRSASPELGTVFVPPYMVGKTVSARRVTRMEIEGLDNILTSGTGAITSGTAVDTQLGYLAGKLRVAQSTNEIAFVLRQQLTPEDTSVAANVRLLVERFSGIKA
jgi:hypothetical protein